MKTRTPVRRTSLSRACRDFLYGLLLVSAFSQGAVGQAADGDAEAPADSQELLVITITGRYTGPQLWKVSHGDHVLWIFPFLSPVPEGLEWDSAQVAQALAEAQEYLPLPRFDMRGVPRRQVLNPDDKELGDVLPPALYERYLTLKADYFPRTRSLERLRPLAAGPSLVSAMYERSGLTAGDAILREIDRLARRNRGLKKTTIRNGVADDLYERLYAENRAVIPAEQEFACFEKSLARIRTDVNLLTRRANAWTEGDMATLRETFAIQDVQDEDKSCAINVTTDGAANEEMNTALRRHYMQWVDAAKAALTSNMSTVAVLDITMLLADAGVLSLLRAEGYTVHAPE